MGQVLVIGRTETLAEALGAESALKGNVIHHCFGVADAIRWVRGQPAQVVLTDPETPINEDLPIAPELSSIRPGIRTIVLASAATSDDVIAAIRAHVFACFTAPIDLREVVDMVRAALTATGWRDGIEVVSGLPHWLTLRVSCHMITVERLVAFMSELQTAVPDHERDLLIAAFRELVLNAMEHGAGFAPTRSSRSRRRRPRAPSSTISAIRGMASTPKTSATARRRRLPRTLSRVRCGAQKKACGRAASAC